MSTLVLDASFAVTACRSADGFAELLVTIDGNLRRGADRLGRVITPKEL